MAAIPTFVKSVSSTADADEYTFTGEAPVSADTVCAVHWAHLGGVTLDSATIGGEDAAILGQVAGSPIGRGVALIRATTGGGDAGDIVLNFSGTAIRVHVGIYTLAGAAASTVDVQTSNTESPANTVSVTVDTGADGAAIGAVACSDNATAGPRLTWTNLSDERYDTTVEVLTTIIGGASEDGLSAGTLDVSAECNVQTNPNSFALIVASFGGLTIPIAYPHYRDMMAAQ